MALFGMDTTIGGNKIGFNPLNPYEHMEDAAKAQEDFINRGTAEHVRGINEALDEYRKQLGLAVEGLDPYTEFGRMSIDNLTALLSDPSSLKDIPGYEFTFQEGQRALERRMPRGLDESGRMAKEMTRYGTDYASTKYSDRLSELMGMSQFGYGAQTQQSALQEGGGRVLADLLASRGAAKAGKYENLSKYVAMHEKAGMENFNTWSGALGGMMGGGFGGGSKPANTTQAAPEQDTGSVNWNYSSAPNGYYTNDGMFLNMPSSSY